MDEVYGLASHASNSCNVTGKTWSLYVNISLAIPSVLACVVALSLAFLLRLYKHFTYRLAMYQVFGSLSWDASIVLSFSEFSDPYSVFYHVMCKLVAFLLVFSMLMKLMFTLWLTFHLFCYVVFFKNLKRLEWLYITSSVFLPLLMSVIPFIHNNYGVAGVWCFVREEKDDCTSNRDGIIEIFALFYGPIVVSLILSVLAIVIMIVVMVRRAYVNSNTQLEKEPLVSSRSTAKTLVKQLLPLLAYPIIFFTLVLIPVVDRLVDVAAKHRNYGLILAHGIAAPVMGFFAGLALFVHILCLRHRNGCTIQGYEETDTVLVASVGISTRVSPSSNTRYSLKAESEVDISMRK